MANNPFVISTGGRNLQICYNSDFRFLCHQLLADSTRNDKLRDN